MQPRFHWELPLDPACADVKNFHENVLEDPMTSYAGIGDELLESFHRKHSRSCGRCVDYGLTNIEVVGP